MNIKQITYLAAVIEHGSLSAAAKDQYVTVQTVSKAIADLERELGRRLFVRESRGMRPTPFCQEFGEKALGVTPGSTAWRRSPGPTASAGACPIGFGLR